jgi:hypothetical protein
MNLPNISMDFFVKKKDFSHCKKLFIDKGLTPAPVTNVFCLPDSAPHTTVCSDLLF